MSYGENTSVGSGLPVFVPSNREQNVAGAVVLAMLGVRHINCIEEGINNIITYDAPIFPKRMA